MTERLKPESRDQFIHFSRLTTRWGDNDVYGHVNNVIYYAWFDTVINEMLIARGLASQQEGAPIGLVVATQCQYFESVSYPTPIEIGVRVESLGTSSVTYRLGVFSPETTLSLACGRYTHVYVDATERRPVALTAIHREVFESLKI